MLTEILTGLDVNQEEAQIYGLLLESGPLQAGKLANRLGCPRSSLYGVLARLQDRGLVSQSVRQGIKVFAAKDPATVLLLFQNRIEELKSAQTAYKQLLPTLLARSSSSLIAPRFQVYEGGEGLKSVLQDMLLYSDISTAALWPIKSMVDILTPQFFRYLNKERIRNRLFTRAIWPANQIVSMSEHPYLGSGPEFYREIRIAPANIKFSMGYWIYADKVAFLASRRESFGFILQSREFVELQTAQFDVLWELSSPLQTDAAASEAFLDEI
jgi:sugar-specific transcriptional regulator TrmB